MTVMTDKVQSTALGIESALNRLKSHLFSKRQLAYPLMRLDTQGKSSQGRYHKLYGETLARYMTSYPLRAHNQQSLFSGPFGNPLCLWVFKR